MTHIRYSTVIHAAPERLWDLMVDPARLTEWNTELAEVLDVSGPLDRVGGGYRQVFRFAGRRWENRGHWDVVAVEPYRHREFRGTILGMSVAGRDSFVPVADGTRIEVEVDYEPPWGVLGQMLDPLMRMSLRRTLARNGDRLAAIVTAEPRTGA